LLSECLTGLTAGLLHHRDGNVDFLRDRAALGTAILLTLLSVVGSGFAVFLAVRISKFWLTILIATIVLCVGLVILATARRRFRYRPGHIVVLGGIAAFNKALSGGGYGPLVTGGQGDPLESQRGADRRLRRGRRSAASRRSRLNEPRVTGLFNVLATTGVLWFSRRVLGDHSN
jgi:hypothetical protein